MAPRTQKQLMALGALVAVLGVVNFMRTGSAPAETPAGQSNAPAAAPRTQAQPGAAAQETVADVRLELLKEPKQEPTGNNRNLFRFRDRTPPPAPPRPAAPPRVIPTGPPVPTGPPPPPPITLRLIGMFNAPTQAGRVAVLSDGRGNVFNGREGDIIEGRYRLLRIGADSAELAYTDGRGRQVIRLSGQ